MASVLQHPEVASIDGYVNGDARRLAEQVRTERERQKQVLNLQRKRVLSQTKSQPGRHAALEAALAQIEDEIKALS
ncbi:MAG: hypothetical protein ABSC77_01685 [Terracidiphilus sp.]|jgi:hypothetical protein